MDKLPFHQCMNECIVWMNMLSYGHIDRIYKNHQKSWDAFHDSALYLSRSLVQGSHSIAGPTFSCRRCAWHRARASKAISYLHNILVLHVFNCKPMTNTFIGHSLMLTLVCLFVKKLCPSLNFLFRAHNPMDSHMLN